MKKSFFALNSCRAEMRADKICPHQHDEYEKDDLELHGRHLGFLPAGADAMMG